MEGDPIYFCHQKQCLAKDKRKYDANAVKSFYARFNTNVFNGQGIIHYEKTRIRLLLFFLFRNLEYIFY